MSITAEIVARLQAQAGSSFQIIGAAAEFSRVADKPRAVPAAYVLPLARDAAASSLTNRVRQMVQLHFGIVIVASDLSDATGGAAAADVETLSDTAIAAVLGWTPASANEPIQYVGGDLLASKGGHVWWQDAIVTGRLYSNV